MMCRPTASGIELRLLISTAFTQDPGRSFMAPEAMPEVLICIYSFIQMYTNTFVSICLPINTYFQQEVDCSFTGAALQAGSYF